MKYVQIANLEAGFGCEISMELSTDCQHPGAFYQHQLLTELKNGNQPYHIFENGEVVGLVTYIF